MRRNLAPLKCLGFRTTAEALPSELGTLLTIRLKPALRFDPEATNNAALAFVFRSMEKMVRSTKRAMFSIRCGIVCRSGPRFTCTTSTDRQGLSAGNVSRGWQAEVKVDASAAFSVFVETYGMKYEKAVGKPIKDCEALLAYYDFPCEHWRHPNH